MGRGRAKAKQTKVARQLKYGPVHSDLGALQAELGHATPLNSRSVEPDESDVDDDPYAAYLQDDDEDAPARRSDAS